MRFFSLVGAGLVFLAAALARAADPAAALAGTWQIDLARSTELSPWKTYRLTISVDGDRVTFDRHLAWGRRAFADTMTVSTRTPAVIPVSLWPDNRHLGAYIGGDRTKTVTATFLDQGRALRLSTDLTLSTQQGERAVNILSDYKVSANGTQLTLTELRTTRNRPVVYVFTRVPASP